ncbi:hypothetical protein FH972_011714 [Carpinus fangiana]|uniref:Neprosin activation peptide domain-containing protein n=1 Tax=Carpinus fangiana TaxID=176857 RepID=A0A660KZ60_9ROSI|nr:hypothetical protein FH972_011714 [Carpinus fangiana]
MSFQARLCFFFVFTFAIMCFARETPLESEKNLGIEDYEEPGANPKHTPPGHPPPKNKRILFDVDYNGGPLSPDSSHPENERTLISLDYEITHTHPAGSSTP